MTANLSQLASDPVAFAASLTLPTAPPVRFADAMADFQRERFASIAPSLIAVARGERPPCTRHWWEATKGASKDSDLAICLLWLLAFSPRALTCQVGAADQDQAGELRKAAADILRHNPWLASRIEVQNWRITCRATGAEVEIVAADTAGSHGARPDVLIVNELSHVTKQEFASNLMDNAAKVPSGLVVIATNAGFIGTWQDNWRNIALGSDRWSVHIWSQPAPWITEPELDEAAQRNTRSRFRRLFWGEWATGAGDAIEGSDIEAALTMPGPMLGTEGSGFTFIGGLDLGTRHDRASHVVLAADHKRQRVRLAHVQSWPPIAGIVPLEAVQAGVLDSHRRYRMSGVYFDPYQAELMSQQLSRVGVPMREFPFVGANPNKMATALLNAFRGRTIDLYRCDELLTALRKLSIVEKSFGFKLTAPRDEAGHADEATALAIALPRAMELSTDRCYGIEWGGVVTPRAEISMPVRQLSTRPRYPDVPIIF